MRVPRWLYGPLMWLSQPRRVALVTTALAAASVALIVGSRAGLWGSLIVLALAVGLVAATWRHAARAELAERAQRRISRDGGAPPATPRRRRSS